MDINMQDQKNTNNKQILLCAAGFLLIAGLCMFFIFHNNNTAKSAAQVMQSIQKDYVKISDPSVSFQITSPETQPDSILSKFQVPELEIEFEALRKEVNPDIYSWILIPDTPINYPIVQHPDDNAYYLNHNLDGSSGYPACIYTENYNSKEWNDVNTILYGHNMKDGSMFAVLHKFVDTDFFKEHPYIYLYSEDIIRVYQIFAAYEFSDLHLISACDWNDSEDVSRFISEIPDYPGIFDNTVELNSDDNYLTLSTCISGKDDKRLLIQAVLVAQASL